MRFTFAILMALMQLSLSRAVAAEPLTLERIYASPELEGPQPRGLEFSQNGKRLTFLQAKTDNIDVLDLWEFDLKTGVPRLLVDSKTLDTSNISEEEKARRERMRMNKGGITERHFSADGSKIVIPAGGDLYLYTFPEKMERLTKTKGAEIDVKFSPKDRFVSFVRDQNLYALDLKSKREHALSREGKGDVSYGVAEFVAQEEMDRLTGYWWSQDEKYVALTRVDEKPVKAVDRYDIDAAGVTVRKQRYPEAGSANAIVQIGVIEIQKVIKGDRKIFWLPLEGVAKDFYLVDAKWTPDHKLAFQIQSRDQKTLDLFQFDPLSKKTRRLLSEEDAHWVDLNGDWRWLKKSTRFLWVSNRSQHKHLYLYEKSGTLVRQLTSGNWDIDEVTGVDEETGHVFFMANRKTPLEKHLYRVSLEGGEPEILTRESGWHGVTMSHDGKFFVRRFSKPQSPTSVFLHKSSGEQISVLSDNRVIEGHPLFPFKEALISPEFGSFRGPSGDELFFSIRKPKNFDPKRKYPMIVSGYGGPGVQVVTNSWGGRGELFADYLVSRGFVVASFDNRGSSRRGKAFANAFAHAFGVVDVEDQVAGVKHLIAQGYIDKDRVGFFGWSYGGYLSLMLAMKASDVFKANAAGAPVTNPALYDTHYTERYLGLPQKEVDAYERANVLRHVSKLSSRLLVVHGMADDNVLFTHSTLLFKELESAGKLFESVTYPGAKHGLYGQKNQTHVGRTVVDFFERHLRP